MGLQTFMWGYDTSDADVGEGSSVTQADVEQQYQAFISKAQSGAFNNTGAIVLTHELDNFTMSEAVKHYPQLKAAFAHIVPVGVGLNITQPYVETNYSLPTFEQYITGNTVVNNTKTNVTTSTSMNSATSATPAASSNPSAIAANGGNSSNGADSVSLMIPLCLGIFVLSSLLL
ncbi:hypothetical protein VKT23_016555 [Stygiomarasmius scandens]|uniref:Chitin deacetylase n=1 Tax=Marasmiellus scandens TaxID=2682957 RepID=A0ABR1IWV0_9AGAR